MHHCVARSIFKRALEHFPVFVSDDKAATNKKEQQSCPCRLLIAVISTWHHPALRADASC